MFDGDRLHDHPAHRGADDVRRRDLERVEQPDGVGGECRERVRRLDRLTADELGVERHHVGRVTGRFRREADIAVVESDDAEPSIEEFADESGRPQRHLRTETHHEQGGGRVVGAEALVTDVDVVDGNGGHESIIAGTRVAGRTRLAIVKPHSRRVDIRHSNAVGLPQCRHERLGSDPA